MLYLTDAVITKVLEWPGLVRALRKALAEITETNGIGVPQRTILKAEKIPLTLYTMPSFSYSQEVACCKMVTQCSENTKRYGLPSISGVVALFDLTNGKVSAILDASALTAWRTAAASLVAAEFLYSDDVDGYKEKTLAVLGAGEQGKIHIRAFSEYFGIKHINLWSRRKESAEASSKELQEQNEIQVNVITNVKECVKNADIIIWAASASPDIYITKNYLNSKAFIISVGTSPNMPSGVAADIFQSSQLFTENSKSAKSEMEEFIERYNLQFTEIGEIILGRKSVEGNFVVYQSLGSALMDAVAGKFVVENYEKLLREKRI